MTEYITAAKAAQILNTSTSFVARLCRKGKLDAKKFGRDWQIELSSVEKYKQTRRPNSNPNHQ